MKISNEVYKRLLNNSINAKQNKYHNEKIVYNGIKFDSKREKNFYIKLKLLESYNMITELKRQVKYEIQPSYEINGKKVRAITYIADFTYKDKKGKKHIVDVKGMKTEVYKLKKKIFEYRYNLEIEEV
jgi:hypothetical protein